MKRMLSTLLVLVMTLSLGISLFAVEAAAAEGGAYSITINNTTEKHTYEAYQIFAGKLNENQDGSKVLSDIQWGSGVLSASHATLGNAADRAKGLTDDNAKAFANEVAAHLDSTQAKTGTHAGGAYTISGLEAGYYLIKDRDGSNLQDDAFTAYILQVVGDVTMKPKSDVSRVEKKVQDTNDSLAEKNDVWQDSADYDVNDHVPFQLTATLADNVSAYSTYKIVFHDKLSKGLTYDRNAEVFFNGAKVTEHFTIDYNDAEHTLTISCNDVKKFNAGDRAVITVQYTATLNDQAVVGAAGNPNTVYLEYSNNPNQGGESSTAQTPVDKVTVFTYRVIINKKNEQNQPLEGAGFTLSKKNNQGVYVPVGAEVTGGSTFTWTGLDDGEYKLEETTTPAGYNTMEPLFFTISAVHEVSSADPKLTALSGTIAGGDNHLSGDVTLGQLATDVINHPGHKLPGTGGMGTTVFYVAGGALILVSGVLLVLKKRKSSEA